MVLGEQGWPLRNGEKGSEKIKVWDRLGKEAKKKKGSKSRDCLSKAERKKNVLPGS